MGSARVVKVYRPPRGTQAFLSIPRFFPGALKSESSRKIFNGLGRRRGKKIRHTKYNTKYYTFVRAGRPCQWFPELRIFPRISTFPRSPQVFSEGPRNPPMVLRGFTFLKFSRFSRFFQGCHSLQAFSGAPRKSSQAFSGAPGSVVRVHRRFQGLPQLDAPRSFPRRSQGSTQGFQIFQVFHGFFQVVKVYRPPRGPGVPRFFPVLPGLS